jgi:hypothetical protein
MKLRKAAFVDCNGQIEITCGYFTNKQAAINILSGNHVLGLVELDANGNYNIIEFNTESATLESVKLLVNG